MGKWIAPLGVLLGAAVWFLLFVILGIGLGTAFIAGGCVVAAGFLVAAMALSGVLDAPLTTTGLLFGITTFVILEVVLSVPMWVGVVSGLAVIGLYNILDAAVLPRTAAERTESRLGTGHKFAPMTPAGASNGHDDVRREPIGAR